MNVAGLATSLGTGAAVHSGNGATHEGPLCGICDKEGLLLLDEIRQIEVTPSTSPSGLIGCRWGS